MERLEAVRVVGKTIFSSFRDPKSQRVQRSLPLPTKTTLVGLLGAAMGIKRTKMPELYDKIQTGVRCWHGQEGGVWDLRIIQKLEAPRGLKDFRRIKVGDKEAFRSLIQRQHHYNSKYVIYYSSEELSPREIVQAFNDPEYALTMSMSDELLLVKDVRTVGLEKHEKGEFSHTVLLGDAESLDLKPTIKEGFKPPLTMEIPVKFEVKRGYRRPTEMKTVTFLTEGKFEAVLHCYLDEDYGFVTFY